jgi:hypothetical protein
MVIAVEDLDRTIVGFRQLQDSAVFRIDVAASKAGNTVYFNSAIGTAAHRSGMALGTAMTRRTIRFGAQRRYPARIDGSSAGS